MTGCVRYPEVGFRCSVLVAPARSRVQELQASRVAVELHVHVPWALRRGHREAQKTLSCLLRQGRPAPSSPSPWPADTERAESVLAEKRLSLRVSRLSLGSRP